MIKTTKPGRDGTVRVTFALPVDDPGVDVSVVGSFNDWDPFAHPMRPRANNTRSAAVTVKAGSTLHFRYLAEGGVWFDDETIAALDGEDVSITVLSGPPARTAFPRKRCVCLRGNAPSALPYNYAPCSAVGPQPRCVNPPGLPASDRRTPRRRYGPGQRYPGRRPERRRHRQPHERDGQRVPRYGP